MIKPLNFLSGFWLIVCYLKNLKKKKKLNICKLFEFW